MVSLVTSSITDKLLAQRHLLELHLVDSGARGAEQRGGCDGGSVLHDGESSIRNRDVKKSV